MLELVMDVDSKKTAKTEKRKTKEFSLYRPGRTGLLGSFCSVLSHLFIVGNKFTLLLNAFTCTERVSFLSAVVAFNVAYNQNKQLIGESGLMPCKNYLSSVKRYVGGRIGAAAWAYTPSILWLVDWSHMDAALDGIALLGMALAAFVLLTGMANMVIMATLWVLYHSLVNVGQLW